MTKAERIAKLIDEYPVASFSDIARLAHVSRQWVADVAGRLGHRSSATDMADHRKGLAVRGRALCGGCWRELPISDMAKRGNSGTLPTRCKRCQSAKVTEYRHRTGRAKRYYADGVRKYPMPDSATGEMIARGGKP